MEYNTERSPRDSARPDEAQQVSYDTQISRLLFLMCLAIPVTLILAVIFYRDSFHLLTNAFSELGQIATASGRANGISRLIFSAGFIGCGATMLVVCVRFIRNSRIRRRRVKGGLALLGAIGFVVAIAPNDLSHTWHSVGMGIIVGVMYFLGTILLVELRRTISPLVFWTTMSLLNATVLTYAVLFFQNSGYKQVAQKACVIGLLLVMEKAATIAPEGFEWRTALQSLRKES